MALICFTVFEKTRVTNGPTMMDKRRTTDTGVMALVLHTQQN